MNITITPEGVAIALLVACAVALVYLAVLNKRAVKLMIEQSNHIICQTNDLITTVDLTRKRVEQTLTVTQANNEALMVIAAGRVSIVDPTVKQRMRQDRIDIVNAEMAGMPSDLAQAVLHDLKEAMEDDKP